MNYSEFGAALGLYSGTPPRKWEQGLSAPYSKHTRRLMELREQLRIKRAQENLGDKVVRRPFDE